MIKSSPDYSLKVDGVEGFYPAGETWAKNNLSEGKIPVFSCEGPCIRGEIARLAANMVAEVEPYARCCHAEVFCVPHSSDVPEEERKEVACLVAYKILTKLKNDENL